MKSYNGLTVFKIIILLTLLFSAAFYLNNPDNFHTIGTQEVLTILRNVPEVELPRINKVNNVSIPLLGPFGSIITLPINLPINLLNGLILIAECLLNAFSFVTYFTGVLLFAVAD